MDQHDTLRRALAALTRAGADQAQARLDFSEKTELNVDAGKLSLLRTTGNASLAMTALQGGRKGTITLNTLDGASIDAAAKEALSFAMASEADPANELSPAAPAQEFGYGPAEPDRGAMYDRLTEFLAWSATANPLTRLEQCILDFTATTSRLANSNGVSFVQTTGLYNFSAIFTSKDGERTSSFNYSGAEARDLARPLKDWGSIERLTRQSAEQLEVRGISGSFEGEVVITPDCMPDLVGALRGMALDDYCLISGTSPYKDKLGQAVAAPAFTLRSLPTSPRIKAGYFFTPDGFAARDATLIEGGVLRSFLLSQYGSKKTGLPRCPSAGGAWVVEPGQDQLASMIARVKRGLLLCRFSGGEPSQNGDFSGVAKNSYLIEDGKIAYPVGETMINGNFCRLVEDVLAVSRETVDFGGSVFPWILCKGVTISGK